MVYGGAEVEGIGKVNSLYLNSGSVATPGTSGSVNKSGFIKTANTLNAKAGSIINLNIVSAEDNQYAYSYVASDKYLFMNATVNVTLSSSYVPKEGDTFSLWSAPSAGNYTGTPIVNLPELPAGLTWDTKKLKTYTGTLTVIADATGIESVDVESSCCHRLYNLAGNLVAEIKSPQEDLAVSAKRTGVLPGTYIVIANNGKAFKIVIR